MVSPAGSITVQYPYIGKLMYEYFISTDKFIAEAVLPYYNDVNQTGFIPVIAREDILKLGDGDGSRAPGAGYDRLDFEWEQKSFATVEYGKEMALDDSRVRATMATAKFDARDTASRLLTNLLLLLREKRAADLLFNATTFATYTSSITNEWDDATNGVPRADVQHARTQIRTNTGREPNGIIVAWSTFWDITATDDFKEWVKYTLGLAAIPAGLEAQKIVVAQYLGLETIHVGAQVYDSAAAGAAFSSADMWDKEYALIGNFAKSGTPIDEPNIGRQILWTPDSPSPVVVEGYREEKVRSEVIRVRHSQDEVVFFPEAGWLFDNVTT